MSGFIVDESKFVIDLDDGIKDDFFVPGQILPGGFCVDEQQDRAHGWQLYLTTDGEHQVLAVVPELKERWINGGFLPHSAFMQVQGSSGQELFALISPASLVTARMTALRAYGSLRYALNVAAAIERTRLIDPAITLRDGIYLELYTLVLPTFTKVRPVCDRALFLNVLSPDQRENIATATELSPSAVNWHSVSTDLRCHGFTLPAIEPYLRCGEIEEVQGFERPLTIAGVISLSHNFQLYACCGEDLLLLLEPDFTTSLTDAGLLYSYELMNLRVDNRLCRALVLSKRQAAETLNDRHFGLNGREALRLAVALAKSRACCPYSNFDDGLYLGQKGIVLPQSQISEGKDVPDDARLFASIVATGPFACAPFDEDTQSALCRLL